MGEEKQKKQYKIDGDDFKALKAFVDEDKALMQQHRANHERMWDYIAKLFPDAEIKGKQFTLKLEYESTGVYFVESDEDEDCDCPACQLREGLQRSMGKSGLRDILDKLFRAKAEESGGDKVH